MSNTVTVTLTHEEHRTLMDLLRISKDNKHSVKSDSDQRIMGARMALGFSMQGRWKFYDWTEQDEEALRMPLDLIGIEHTQKCSSPS